MNNVIVNVVDKLQKISTEVFKSTVASFETGLSEWEIAEIIEREFLKRGIQEFWYTAPHNVLIGEERFKIGTTTTDYAIKSPSQDSLLKDGSIVYIDFSPVDSETKLWGDWSSMVVFHPRNEIDDEQVQFLAEIRNIHREGLAQISTMSTGFGIFNYYLKAFGEIGVTLLDVRKNVGHSMHSGQKDKAKRIWLDDENAQPLGEGIFAIEPGGYRGKKNGVGSVVARFEECIYIPKDGNAVLLGNKKLLPLIV